MARMRRLLPLYWLVPLACTSEVESPPPKSFVTSMSLEDGKESVLECNTGQWTGRISIAPDVRVDYKNVSTSSAAGAESKTTLTLDGVPMTVEEGGLRFGADSRVRLSDNVAVEIRKDGVYIAGDKALALPVK